MYNLEVFQSDTRNYLWTFLLDEQMKKIMLDSQNNYFCLLIILISVCKNNIENHIIKMDLKSVTIYFLNYSNGS